MPFFASFVFRFFEVGWRVSFESIMYGDAAFHLKTLHRLSPKQKAATCHPFGLAGNSLL